MRLRIVFSRERIVDEVLRLPTNISNRDLQNLPRTGNKKPGWLARFVLRRVEMRLHHNSARLALKLTAAVCRGFFASAKNHSARQTTDHCTATMVPIAPSSSAR